MKNPQTSARACVPYLTRVYYGPSALSGNGVNLTLPPLLPAFLRYYAGLTTPNTAILPNLSGVPTTALVIQNQSASSALQSTAWCGADFSTTPLGGGYDTTFEYAALPNVHNIFGDPYDGPYYVNPGITLGFNMAVAASTTTIINVSWWEE